MSVRWFFFAAVGFMMAATVAPSVSAVASAPATTSPTATQSAASHPSGGPIVKVSDKSEAEMEKEMMDTLSRRLPLRHERLIKLKAANSKEYDQYRQKMMDWYKDWRCMPPAVQDTQIREQLLKVRAWQIVDRLRNSPPAHEAQKLRAELREIVSDHFDAEQKMMEHRLTVLEDDINRLHKKLHERSAERERLIQERAEKLLRSTTRPAGEKEQRQRAKGQ